MKVKVRLFARLAELAGTRETEVELGEGLSVAEAFDVLCRRFPEMATRVMRQIAAEATARWLLTGIAMQHRTGRLEIGETSLVIAVSSPHRKEAFEACHHLVDRFKEVVPVWKKEVWEGGEVWIEGEPVERP